MSTSQGAALKSALIHEWLVTVAGAESVLRSIYRLYPGDIYTLFHDPTEMVGTEWEHARITTSMLQRMPWGRKRYRAYLPLFPMAVEQFDLRNYKLIISSSYAVAKGVMNSADQLHICYCHSPMRYVWDLQFEYLESHGLRGGLKSFAVRLLFHYIRMWDQLTAQRVNHFVANSQYIAHRIRKSYGRDATVIYPPVDVDQFVPGPTTGDYFITASRLVPYKRIDLAVKAFNELGLKLVVVGDGPARKSLERLAGPTITFLGHLPTEEMQHHLQAARAFVFSAEEDFGIVNVEAQASGVPVIAYGRGGALETVIDGKTGLFFQTQDTAAIVGTVKRFLEIEKRFTRAEIRANAERFPRSRFETEFKAFVDKSWEEFPYK